MEGWEHSETQSSETQSSEEPEPADRFRGSDRASLDVDDDSSLHLSPVEEGEDEGEEEEEGGEEEPVEVDEDPECRTT